MDKVILAALALAVFLQVSGAFEGSSSAGGDNPYLADSQSGGGNAEPAAQRNPAPQGQGTIIVYGRDGSGETRTMRRRLKEAELAHRYKDIEEPKVMLELGRRLQRQGYDKERYELPVVAVGRDTWIQPDPSKVIASAQDASR